MSVFASVLPFTPRVVAEPAPCRVCGDPAYMVDDEDLHVHPCCVLHQESYAERGWCLSCSASAANGRKSAPPFMRSDASRRGRR